MSPFAMNPTAVNPTALFRALSDETRLRCLALISAHDEICVCDFTDGLELSQPKISRHLAYLRSNGVVKDRRVRTMVFYRLSDELPDWALEVLDKTLAAIDRQAPFREDLERLKCLGCRQVEQETQGLRAAAAH